MVRGALNVFVAAGQASGTAGAIISAAGALLGVVLGGFLTATLESIRQRRREERLERAAGRLLSDELAQTHDAFVRIADERVVRRAGIPEPIASWDQYRELLASRMADLQWRTVAKAVLAARNLCGELEQLAASDVGLGQLPTSLGTQLRQTADTLDNAASLLAARGEED
jgi:hypothetical protein